MTPSEMLLFLRFAIGYPTMAVAGFVLGTVALGRLRTMKDGKRRLYRPLVSVAFGMCWTGAWGVMGVWQYGTFTVPFLFPMSVVSAAFSVGILWIGFSLAALAIVVLIEEFQHSATSQRNLSR